MGTTTVELRPVADGIAVTESELVVELADGRRLSVPLVWFPRLLHASEAARNNWQLLGGGEGIHWPDVDEDLSVRGLLLGVPSAEYRKSA
ncbi:MAG: DUF2442 domain-containing protein [Thermoanaerobaculales bacterium]|nr:DUF2442 domain-containing protein [Thermoanaerobaculales bacterium]